MLTACAWMWYCSRVSTTTVFLAYPDRVDKITSLGNSWGSGAFVWSALSEKYLGDGHIWSCNPAGAEKLWALVGDPKLSTCERIVLASTFDYAIVETAKFREAAEHWANFEGLHRKVNQVCHAGAISALLLKHYREGTPCVGMCFWLTSVAENPWCDWDEEKDEPVPFSLETYKHFFVFEEFEREPKEV